MLFHSFSKAFADLLLPGIIRLLLLTLVAYIVSWVAVTIGLVWLLGALFSAHAAPYGLGWLTGGFGATILAWIFFPLLYPLLVSFFDDAIAEQIERHDYPQIMRAAPPFWPTIWHDFIFSVKAVLWNIVILPLLLFPPLHFIVYYWLNGRLLGAQFFRMAAGRRMSRVETEALINRQRGKIVIGGAVIMLCATIPVVNLIAPVLGVAAMLHLFHAVNGDGNVAVY